VDVSALMIGDSIKLSGVKVPEGVKVMDDANLTIFTVSVPKVEKVEEPVAAEGEAVEGAAAEGVAAEGEEKKGEGEEKEGAKGKEKEGAKGKGKEQPKEKEGAKGKGKGKE
jgi:hypothetical protein